MSKLYKGKDKPFIGKLADEIITYLNQCFVDSECINPFIFNTLITTFITFLSEVTDYIVGNSSSINSEIKEALSFSILKLIKPKYKRKLSDIHPKKKIEFSGGNINKKVKIIKILQDFQRFIDPDTQRNFFVFIDCNLRNSSLATQCIEKFISTLKDTDKLSVIRVGRKNETILPLTECKWAKKNHKYLLSMVESPPYINYLEPSNNILEGIIQFMTDKDSKQYRRYLESTQNSESWVIGIHGKMMSEPRNLSIKQDYEKLYEKYKMYTIVLGTKKQDAIEEVLRNTGIDNVCYSQYGGLTIRNVEFITKLLKMQKYKESHFLFTERLLDD